MSETTTTSSIPTAGNPAAHANLPIAVIENAVRVIDHAAEQGAYKGWQVIEQVLNVRNALADFLRLVQAQASAPAPDADSAVQ